MNLYSYKLSIKKPFRVEENYAGIVYAEGYDAARKKLEDAFYGDLHDKNGNQTRHRLDMNHIGLDGAPFLYNIGYWTGITS